MDSRYAGATVPNAVVPPDKQKRRISMAFQDLLTEAFNLIVAALVDGLIARLLAIIGWGA